MSTALRSVGLLDILSSMSAGPSVARLVSTPVCAASLRKPVRNAGQEPVRDNHWLFFKASQCLKNIGGPLNRGSIDSREKIFRKIDC
jgi:hypothetical protein